MDTNYQVDGLGDDELLASEAIINREEEFSTLSPERKLVAWILAKASDDLDVVISCNGRLTDLSDEDRLNAASAAYFFLKGAARGYMQVAGFDLELPRMQGKALRVAGSLGGVWARHLAMQNGHSAERQMMAAISASRAKTGIRKLVPTHKGDVYGRTIASLV